MDDVLRALNDRMEAAAAALDFEEARRLRDRIALIRNGASAEDAAAADLSDTLRQRPGAMGLGSGRGRPEPPAGWTPPPRPDPMTRGQGRAQGKSRR